MNTVDKKPTFNKQAFWRFSFDFYQNKAVEEACLMLQDEYQLDVNLVMFLLFYSKEKQRIVGSSHIEKILDAMAQPDEWVQEFRRFRKQFWLKVQQTASVDVHDVKQALLDSELTLEAQVQSAIIDYANKYLTANEPENPRVSVISIDFLASENMETYFNFIHSGHDEKLWQAQQTLSSYLITHQNHHQAA